MGKGGGKGKGGYPWWEHIKGGKGGGAKGGDDGGKAAAGYDGAAAGPPPKRSNGPISGLQRRLQEMEGRQYPSYKDLSGGGWEIEGRSMTLYFDRVQGDAYAPPSWIRARVPMSAAGFPATFVKESRVRNTALCDYVTRVLADLLHGGAGTDWTQTVQGAGWSSSKGGDIQVDAPGQYVIERTSVVANAEFIEARLTLALPAKGRSIEGYRAAEIVGGLCDAVKGALFYSSLDGTSLRGHIETVEDQDALRNQLCELGLVAFVGNGAILPRKSGVDDRPMTKADSPNLVDFKSPAAFEVTIKLPHAGQVTGMAIKKGVTVIVGGGFHGKSTLLQALQLGIYNKVPGDGREFVVCEPRAVKIRAEDGRSVRCTDISPFINNLPFGKKTTQFSTGDASGSTSQAANIVEALEVGATSIFVDEDTCATNFMIRDEKMKALVAPDKEPITAFVLKVRALLEEHGVSTVLVVGGSGDFFAVADAVVMMDEYAAIDVTERAQEIAKSTPPPKSVSFGKVAKRRLLKSGLAAEGKVNARNLRVIQYGETEIELSCIEQLVETSQARAIGDALQLLGDGKLLGGSEGRPLASVLEDLERQLHAGGRPVGEQGLDSLSRYKEPCPFYVMPRRLELAAAV
eukprot:CAMPEP_0115082166 /NCGR_PEP_ID=MMETSP0227-20121206/19735_1 /TAXON_ID=89957 /ORGANISM="Polarella glacialis, Strain CCMP 1383" /LENGTH=629 /DNA_ID=CAMNT_0002470195 /DNA_START=306 /DNA_END=2192 /DNA_ORIENTATION=-